jgi:hypothetical protein
MPLFHNDHAHNATGTLISDFAPLHPGEFDAGVVVVIFQNSMLDATRILMEGGFLAIALCGQTTIFWVLDDPLLSFPRRGMYALGCLGAVGV